MHKNDEKILLILDLDETLIHATDKNLNLVIDFKIFNYNVYKRPFLDDFLQEIKDDFLLAIWSSADDEYVNEITKKIIPKEIQLEFIWGRSKCTYQRNHQIGEYGYYDDHSQSDYHYIKPLKKLKKKGYDLNRILIVDDSPHKSKDNYGNAIYPKKFTGDHNDSELRKLSKYLKQLKHKENIRRIEKRNWQSNVK